MIKTVNLQKIYRTEEVETTALNSVNIQINEGEFVGIMGPSGCGKSTLLNVLGLLDNPTDGEYYLLDNEVFEVGTRDYYQNMPPAECEGGDNCRGFYIPISPGPGGAGWPG